VHILRDADEAAASLLAFRQDDGTSLVVDAEGAYAYWLRRAEACVAAERALGPGIVHRVRHADLAADPEPALRGILEFLGEPFAPACLEPLRRRINSSFADESAPRERPQADAGAKAHFDADFDERVRYTLQWPSEYRAAQRVLSQLKIDLHALRAGSAEAPDILQANRAALERTRKGLTVSGAVLFALWLTMLAMWVRPDRTAANCGLTVATLGLLIYAWLRRAGLRALWRRLLGKNQTTAKEPQ
jgi:hypothetical protein